MYNLWPDMWNVQNKVEVKCYKDTFLNDNNRDEMSSPLILVLFNSLNP